MTSTSSEGLSSIFLKLKPGSNVDQFMRDLRSQLDQITDLPDEAEEPEMTRLEARFPVISMSLYGDSTCGFLYQTADDVKRRLLNLPGVASVGIAGDREWELWVEVDPQILAARGLHDDAAQAFAKAVVTLEGLGSRLELGRALYHQGTLQADVGDIERAEASITRALYVFTDSGAVVDADRARRFDWRGAAAAV